MHTLHSKGSADSSSRTIQRFPRYRHPLISKQFSEIELKQIHWLWPNRIPKGKLTVILGDTGAGKSLLMAYIASRVSSGRKLPRQKKGGTPRPVIMVSFEDDPEDTIKPRLTVVDADQTRIGFIFRKIKKGKKQAEFRIPEDIYRLENDIRTLGVKLVTIDPLMGGWSVRLNSWKEQHTRHLLDALADVAERTGAAICLVTHPNKRSELKAIYRASGSMALVAAPRSVLLLGPDPQDPSTTILTGIKTNLGALPRSLAFRIEKVTLKAEGKKFKTARLVYVETSPYTADELMDPNPLPRTRAKRIYKRELAHGSKPAKEIEAVMKKEHISKRTADRAKSELGVKSDKKGGFASKGLWDQELSQKAK